MSTDQCVRLLAAYRVAAAKTTTRAIVLLCGKNFWSNGIHLNTIEASDDPAEESWKNIHAIDDVAREVITAATCITISAMRGNAGAGGVMFALSVDKVEARGGIVLNPHLKTTSLYGSEYWTYWLPKRVGKENVNRNTEECLPVSTSAAFGVGMLEEVFGSDHESFRAGIQQRAETIANNPTLFAKMIVAKVEGRRRVQQVSHCQEAVCASNADLHRDCGSGERGASPPCA